MSDDSSGLDVDARGDDRPVPRRTNRTFLLTLVALTLTGVGVIGSWIDRLTRAGHWSSLDHWWVVPILIALALYGYALGHLSNRAYDGLARSRGRR